MRRIMFSSHNPAEWQSLAYSLSLSPYTSIAGFSFGSDFRQLRRRLTPASAPPSFSHWLCGQRRGMEVVVLTYDTGSGSSTTTWTGALARIDPPLFLGLSVAPHSFMDGVLCGVDIQVSHSAVPGVDERFRILGFDAERIRQLLSGDLGLLSRMVGLSTNHNVRLSDSFVLVSVEGTLTNPSIVSGMLEGAIDLAAALAARKKQIPFSPGEIAQQAEWRRFAEANRFTFDSGRMELAGTRHGVTTVVSLETEGAGICTTVIHRFASAVRLTFEVTPSLLPSFLQGIFGQDIKIGDPEFDRLYRVTGCPADAVRIALARPRLLDLLKRLRAQTNEVQLSPSGLCFTLPGPSPRASDIEQVVSTGYAASSELLGEQKGMGPYR